MVQAYNFLASWQLFPEKCTYEKGVIPKSGNYKIETAAEHDKKLTISYTWVTVENEAYHSNFYIIPDGEQHGFQNKELAATYRATFSNTYTLLVTFYNNNHTICLEISKEIMPNGFLKITKKEIDPNGTPQTNIDIYHKQMSVLPYSSSVSGVAIRPTKQGVIKHKALMAMEEQTNMQLDQIRQQIELLAKQAQELKKRKELSLMIYESKLNFKPQIGQVYHLYENLDGSSLLSLIAPKEWGKSGPFKSYVSSVKLLADHTWVEVF